MFVLYLYIEKDKI